MAAKTSRKFYEHKLLSLFCMKSNTKPSFLQKVSKKESGEAEQYEKKPVGYSTKKIQDTEDFSKSVDKRGSPVLKPKSPQIVTAESPILHEQPVIEDMKEEKKYESPKATPVVEPAEAQLIDSTHEKSQEFPPVEEARDNSLVLESCEASEGEHETENVEDNPGVSFQHIIDNVMELDSIAKDHDSSKVCEAEEQEEGLEETDTLHDLKLEPLSPSTAVDSAYGLQGSTVSEITSITKSEETLSGIEIPKQTVKKEAQLTHQNGTPKAQSPFKLFYCCQSTPDNSVEMKFASSAAA